VKVSRAQLRAEGLFVFGALVRILRETKMKAKRPKRLLDWDDLEQLGIPYTKNHLRRMWADGRFPPPVNISPRKLVWDADAVNAWIEQKLKAA
jgi:predicted DNA-binding transcriptional regulator AlpA